MELLYIYLGEVKDKTKSYVFENQGFKFTSEFEINYDKISKKLTISENEDYDPNFYKVKDGYKASFKVTCVVGENGAGKTCVLEMIKSLCCKECNLSFNIENYKNYLIIWKKEDEVRCLEFKLGLESLQNNNLISYAFNEEVTINDWNNDVVDNAFILYNNYIDEFSIEYEDYNPNLIDISFQGILFEQDDFDYLKDNINNNASNISVDLLKYKTKEFNKKLNFYFNQENQDFIKNNFIKDKFLKDKNNKLERNQVWISIQDYSVDSFQKYFKQDKNFLNLIKIEDYIIKRINDSNSSKDVFLWNLAKSFCIKYLICLNNIYKIFKNKKFVNECKKENLQLDDKIEPKNFVRNNVFKFIKNTCKKSNILLFYDHIQPLLDYVKEFYKEITVLFEQSEVIVNEKYLIVFLNSEKTKKKEKIIKELIRLFELNEEIHTNLRFKDCNILNFTFLPRYSAGENSLITLLSRIYHSFKYNGFIKETINKKKQITFLIDEGEIGFHPQWCKKYVEILISYLQELFAEHNIHIHLIITTNNPIVLSDILPDDVIYLKNKTSLTTDKRPKMAFGSNILDLYSDNFFIQDGLIGSFAQKKLSDLLEKINSDEFKPNSNDENLIKNIGDINIRNYISALYNGAKTKYFAKNGISND